MAQSDEFNWEVSGHCDNKYTKDQPQTHFKSYFLPYQNV